MTCIKRLYGNIFCKVRFKISFYIASGFLSGLKHNLPFAEQTVLQSFWQPMASIVITAPAISKRFNSLEIAVISFDLSSTLTGEFKALFHKTYYTRNRQVNPYETELYCKVLCGFKRPMS